MLVSLIVAMDRNGVIGNEGDLPWRLSSDLKHFRELTMGKPIIMGRKTHESIGRPLPGRENVVITRDTDYLARGCTVLNSLECVFAKFSRVPEIIIMGGAELYQQTLDRAGRIYLTEVHADCTGDTFFPEFNHEAWKETERQDYQADDRNEHDYSFVVLEKITPEDQLS